MLVKRFTLLEKICEIACQIKELWSNMWSFELGKKLVGLHCCCLFLKNLKIASQIWKKKRLSTLFCKKKLIENSWNCYSNLHFEFSCQNINNTIVFELFILRTHLSTYLKLFWQHQPPWPQIKCQTKNENWLF